jgi:uncharacterized protein with PQ loop repeat
MEVSVSVHGVTNLVFYKYSAIFLGSTSFIPQIVHSWRRNEQMNDVSYTFMGMLLCGVYMWAMYMYESDKHMHAYATVIFSFNILILIIMKIYFYMKSFQDYYKPPKTIDTDVIIAAAEILKHKESA